MRSAPAPCRGPSCRSSPPQRCSCRPSWAPAPLVRGGRAPVETMCHAFGGIAAPRPNCRCMYSSPQASPTQDTHQRWHSLPTCSFPPPLPPSARGHLPGQVARQRRGGQVLEPRRAGHAGLPAGAGVGQICQHSGPGGGAAAPQPRSGERVVEGWGCAWGGACLAALHAAACPPYPVAGPPLVLGLSVLVLLQMYGILLPSSEEPGERSSAAGLGTQSTGQRQQQQPSGVSQAPGATSSQQVGQPPPAASSIGGEGGGEPSTAEPAGQAGAQPALPLAHGMSGGSDTRATIPLHTPALVMEYVPGLSLRQLIERGERELSPAACLVCARDLAKVRWQCCWSCSHPTAAHQRFHTCFRLMLFKRCIRHGLRSSRGGARHAPSSLTPQPLLPAPLAAGHGVPAQPGDGAPRPQELQLPAGLDGAEAGGQGHSVSSRRRLHVLSAEAGMRPRAASMLACWTFFWQKPTASLCVARARCSFGLLPPKLAAAFSPGMSLRRGWWPWLAPEVFHDPGRISENVLQGLWLGLAAAVALLLPAAAAGLLSVGGWRVGPGLLLWWCSGPCAD